MGLFDKKSPEEKIATKAAKKQEKKEIEEKLEEIHSHLGFLEKVSHPMQAAQAAMLVPANDAVLAAVAGDLEGDGGKCVLVATESRIIFGSVNGFSVGSTELPYENIDKVENGTKLSGSWIAFHNGSQRTAFKGSSGKTFDKLVELVRQKKEAAARPAASSAVSGPNVDDLSKLAELHKAGILTDAEFAAAKAKALGL